MSDVLAARREASNHRFEKARDALAHLEEKSGNHACVYVTGSFARSEASEHSDLDLFIVGDVGEKPKDRSLTQLDEICLKANLITMTRHLDFPEFSGDGEYLVHYTVTELVQALGRPDDDANNTFTARLLLLLESRPLLGAKLYRRTIEQVIDAYWRDYEDHQEDFVPAFLANDILRLWRTFCVNYEARTSGETPDKKARRKLKNYKLKHSRLLTCYSALASLLHVHSKAGTVTPDQAKEIVERTPTERLEWLAEEHRPVAGQVAKALDHYRAFLVHTGATKQELLHAFQSRETAAERMNDARRFGELMFDVLYEIRGTSELYRVLIV